jgi:hypothetical protein
VEGVVGASGWYYAVPYKPDIAAALQQLRQEVYDRGEYYRPRSTGCAEKSEEELRAKLRPDQWESGMNDAILEDYRASQERPAPVDPDTLLASQPHSGTHSIIDIDEGIAATPTPYTVSPLSDDELLDLFRTTRPTSDQVRGLFRHGGGSRDKWVGTYVLSFLDGQPDEIHFFGISGG